MGHSHSADGSSRRARSWLWLLWQLLHALRLAADLIGSRRAHICILSCAAASVDMGRLYGCVSHCREAVCKEGMQRPDTHGTLLGFCLTSSPAPASCRFWKALAHERGLNSTLPLTAKCAGTPCRMKRITCSAGRAAETTQQPREWNLLEGLSNANILSKHCQNNVKHWWHQSGGMPCMIKRGKCVLTRNGCCTC